MIIREAARSPLGIIALCVLATAVIAWSYFAKAKQNLRFAAFIALVASLLLFIVAANQVATTAPWRYGGRVIDAASLAPIRNARVTLDLNGQPSISEYTDSDGGFSLLLPRSTGVPQQLRVEANNFDLFERNLAGDATFIPSEIRLRNSNKSINPQSGAAQSTINKTYGSQSPIITGGEFGSYEYNGNSRPPKERK